MLRNHVIRFTREELHRRVWEKPIRSLAKEVGVSDVMVSKTCRKAKIPVPWRGYWAKAAAGKPVRPIPLPVLDDADLTTLRRIEFWPRRTADEPAGPVAAQIVLESRVDQRIRVPEVLRQPHPLVRATSEALNLQSRQVEAGYVQNWHVPHLDIEVSDGMLKRALRILDAVVKSFESRGWPVSVDLKDRNSYVTILGQRIRFGIREPRRQIPIPTPERRTFDPKYREEPSGRLALVLRESWGRSIRRSTAENATRALENRLNDFMVAAVALAHERAEWERRRLELEETRRKSELARLEEQRREAEEAARVRALEDQAARWRRSRAIRDYIAAVRAASQEEGEFDPSAEMGAWLEWAERHARSLDPVEDALRAFPAPRAS